MSPQQVVGVLVWSTKVVDGQLADYTYDGRARRG